MAFLQRIKEKLAIELEVRYSDFIYPPQNNLGDFSLACFELAKKKKISPNELARQLRKKLQASPLNKLFEDIKTVGPYLNFFISSTHLSQGVISDIRKERKKYGTNNIGKGLKVAIEYSNANTHKEYHVGHLRNLSYGDAITKILACNGYQVIPVSYINDFGIHTAKTIWNWLRNKKYQQSTEDRGYLLGKCYSEASKILGESEEHKDQLTNIMKEIESRQGDTYELWKKTRQWSINYFNSIYKEMGVKFSHVFYESEIIEQGFKIVKELLAKGVLIESQGAIIADLEKYDLGVLPIIRSDGTALYPVADLALATEKFKKYNTDESVYVVDVRQNLYFKQLFKILELSSYQQKFIHLSYDFVTLPNGMMSSRSGNVITYRALKKEIFDKLFKETIKRHEDWTKSRIKEVVNRLTISVIKFEMLKINPKKIIVFNIDTASNFEGQTACYLQYGYARLKSIIRKQSTFPYFYSKEVYRLQKSKEQFLLLKLAKYPEIIKLAGDSYDPSIIAKYLFELVQMFNDYYHETNILKSEKKDRMARIILIKAIAQVLENGYNVLGIKRIEEM